MDNIMMKEFGKVQRKIANTLCEDYELCQLLVNTTSNPFDIPLDDNYDAFKTGIITVVPLAYYDDFKESKVVVNLPYAVVDPVNPDFVQVTFTVDVIVHKDLWVIDGEELRPFSIMGLICEDINHKRLSSIGTLEWQTIEENAVSNEITMYTMSFAVHTNG